MQNTQDMIQRLNLSGSRLSKSHRRIAEYILQHYDKAVFMTAAKLGEMVNVSESTVVRFAVALGYEGYPELQQALQELVRHRLTATQRFEMSSDISQEEVLSTVLKADMQNIRSTIDGIDNAAFLRAVQVISGARRIYILGLRSAAPLAQFAGYYLHYIFDDVRVVAAGSTDVFEAISRIEASDVLERLGLEPHKYMLLSAHREENIDTEKNFIDLFTSINHLAQTYDMPILYSCHPRSKKRLDAMGFQLDERVKLHEPLGFHDYNHLQMNAFAVVSDSGTLPEESSFFTSVGHPFPAVCIRTSTERPEALDKGCFVLAGISEGGVEQAVATAVAMNANGDNGIPVPYYTEDVSTKVVKIIQSYTGVVNKMVWRKN